MNMHQRLLMACLILGAAPTLAPGQTTTPTGAAFQRGVTALQAGHTAEAISLLRRTAQKDPALRDSLYGSAAYWLGRAYERAGQLDSAHAAWTDGVAALEAERQVDPRLGSAFVRSVFERRDTQAYDRALRTYLQVLEAFDPDVASEAEHRMVARLVAQMLVLWPEEERRRVVYSPETLSEPDAPLHLEPDAGPQVAAWWRGQDLLPTTAYNERLAEHLARVAYAEARYASAGHPSGLDARGRVYVRLGPPRHTARVSYSQVMDQLYQLGTSVGPADLPPNTFWTYPHVDERAYFLFVEGEDGWELADTQRLFPETLRTGIGASPRGRRKAYVLLQLMREVYRHLSIHPDFVSRYADASDHALGASREPPYVAAQRMLTEGQSQDDYLSAQRAEHVPPQYTNTFDDYERLPLALRTARFLNPDGTTRTEVFWSHPSGTQALPDEDRLVTLGAVQFGPDYRQRSTVRKQYLRPAGAGRGLSVRTLMLPGDSALYHLHLQWDEYEARPGASSPADTRLGAHRRMNSLRLDSVRALSADPATLEMSDLLPVIHSDTEAAALGVGAPVTPYPLRRIQPGLPLALRFDVYHLAFGEDDRTRYAVEYEIERRTEGGLWQLFRDGEERTATQVQRQSTSRTAHEYMLVDLSERANAGGLLRITVRVTDKTTGLQTERAIEFQSVAAPEQ